MPLGLSLPEKKNTKHLVAYKAQNAHLQQEKA
jgi:hypothetical protein